MADGRFDNQLEINEDGCLTPGGPLELAKGETVPRCPGPGVQCLVDPCGRLAARCLNGMCSAK